MNNLLLIILIVACSYMEISQKINTDDTFEKIGVLLIVLGAGLTIFKFANNLMLYGTTVFFLNLVIKGYISKHDRRKADHMPRKRKLLS